MPAIYIPKRLVEISLINTAAVNPQNFVNHCEIEYEYRVVAAAAEVAASGCRVVLLTGPSSSGKTTTAHKLANALCTIGKISKVISLDDFYLDLDKYPRLPDGSKDYENVYALDIPEIQRCIRQLVETSECDVPQFDFRTESRMEKGKHLDLRGGVAVVEGIHALNPLMSENLPEGSVFKVYAGLREEYSHMGQRVLPTRDIRLARRMVRDAKFRGHSLEKTMRMWPSVCAGEDQNIRVFKKHADFILDTSFSYEICCLAPYIRELADDLPDGSPCQDKYQSLLREFEQCEPISEKIIPKRSMLREFIG